MIGYRQAVPLFIYTLAFALQLRKSTENFNQDSRAVLGIARCVDLAACRGGLDLLSVHPSRSVDRQGFQTDLGRRRYRTKGFPSSDNFESKLSANALM
jgi:hypothetical protein